MLFLWEQFRKGGSMREQLNKVRVVFMLILITLANVIGLFTSTYQVVSARRKAPVTQTAGPQYKTDGTPKYAWTIPGQSSVVNGQGGISYNGDQNTSWNGDPNDTKNSYLKFGSDTTNPDYAIRKYARETKTPGLYDLYLNVKGNQKQDIKPIDIVLVVDMSGSMEPLDDNGHLHPVPGNPNGTNRAQAVRDGVKNFLQAINNAGLSKYVKVGLVGFSSPGYVGGGKGYVTTSLNQANQQQANAINTQLSQKFQGGTFTQEGISQGSQMLANDQSGNKKLMIVLTDGVPTFSYHVTKVHAEGKYFLFADEWDATKIDEPGWTSIFAAGYEGPWGNGYTVDNHRIVDTWPATLGQAAMAKEISEVHALGIQLTGDGSYSLNDVRYRMRRIASSANLFEEANDATDITDYLNSQASDVIKNFSTVPNGKIVDPLGSQFSYAGNSADVRSVGSAPVAVANLPKATISNGQLNVTGMNLGKNQEVQIHYQVRINTEDQNFTPDKWYQMNGKTTFTPDADNSTSNVDFVVPSAKAPGVTLNVKKVWQTFSNPALPDSINFTVKRNTPVDNNSWTSATGKLFKTDNWQKSFSKLTANGSSVSLPKFNNHGEDFTYQVTSEDNVPGFSTSIASSSTQSTITNTELGFMVEKYDQQSPAQPLSGAQYQLSRYDVGWQHQDNSFAPIMMAGNQDKVSLKSGYYQVKETKAPPGFQLNTISYQFQVTTDGRWLDNQGKEITTSALPSSPGFYHKSNGTGGNVLALADYDSLKPYTLTVNKVDDLNGKPIAGAAFKLVDASGTTISQKETGSSVTFTYANLKPGTYTLTETKAPDGYALQAETMTIQIAQDGKVSFPAGSTGSYQLVAGQNQNTINLQVKNGAKGMLPATGGPGISLFIAVGAFFTTISITGFALLKVRQRKRVMR